VEDHLRHYKADLSILDPMVKDGLGQVRHREEDHAARLLQGELARDRLMLNREFNSGSFRGAAKRRARKSRKQEFPMRWIPGSRPMRVKDARERAYGRAPE